jgi:hypothetical protein
MMPTTSPSIRPSSSTRTTSFDVGLEYVFHHPLTRAVAYECANELAACPSHRRRTSR